MVVVVSDGNTSVSMCKVLLLLCRYDSPKEKFLKREWVLFIYASEGIGMRKIYTHMLEVLEKRERRHWTY